MVDELTASQHLRQNAPADFCCSITKRIMTDPVVTPQGISYEREAIMEWLAQPEERYCPVTGEPLSQDSLKPNTKLMWKIRFWQQKNEGEDETEEVSDASSSKPVLDKFRCPLTGKIMTDPVMTRSGHNYERAAIMQWLNKHGNVCPMSGKPLTRDGIIGNAKLQWEIERFRAVGNEDLIIGLESITLEEEEGPEQQNQSSDRKASFTRSKSWTTKIPKMVTKKMPSFGRLARPKAMRSMSTSDVMRGNATFDDGIAQPTSASKNLLLETIGCPDSIGQVPSNPAA